MTAALAWDGPLDWPITSGVIPILVLALGWLALVGLAVSSSTHWWSRRFPCAVLLTAALTVLVRAVVNDWWQPWPDGLTREVVFWVGIGILGLLLALFRLPPLRWRGRFAAVGAALLVLLMSGSEINRQYDQYPTLRVLLAPWIQHTPTFSAGRATSTLSAPAGRTLAEVWHSPAGLPAKGTITTTAIPGHKSGFDPRDAYIYLPPAYQATAPRPLLPVLVLMAGQPGGPADWVNSGDLAGTMDSFAAAHQGLAPIVVVVDPTGSDWANTLCMDSKIAKAQTYLAQDVPDWVHAHLQTGTGRGAFAIGGLSLGGTCSLQMAVNAPQVYGSFLDISGQDEPTLGSHDKTVQAAFGGNEAAFDAVDPLHVMARQKFPDTAAAFVVGKSDGEYGPQQRKVYQAAVAAGMRATFTEVPGGHDWNTFRAGLSGQLTWLSQQLGLIG
ncbi:alpha/beta hydrolase [Kitasatospora sp. NBC_01302]|uniref:alpha/beta hydrolase n=1 Tax=Kitasatospora sp. NBC_01302 TaxID=2903575 RepID=UPI002E160CD0|nr:esterase family protein [Kitasatospora sp. NBC_01302]